MAQSALTSLIKRLFGSPTPPSEAEVRAYREAHKLSGLRFKLLLAANNRALEVMTDLEEAQKGARPFGLTYVRTQAVRAGAAVFQIVTILNELTGNKYAALVPRLKDIQARINEAVRPRAHQASGPLVVDLAEAGAELADEVGGKVANLGEVGRKLGLPIPRGFAITASAYTLFMRASDLQAEIDRLIQSADATRLDELYGLSSTIQQIIIRAPLPPDLAEAITTAYARLAAELGYAPRVAMRSSALGEDTLNASFAGQYRSELNVSGDDLLATYKEIIASKYGVTAMSYRLSRGIPDEDVAMCVGVMRMVEARAGGVAYSRSPFDFRDPAVYVNAVPGLPKAVVDGSSDPDLFVVNRNDPPAVTRRRIADKKWKFVCDPVEGVCRLELAGGEAGTPAISDDEALAIAAVAARAEEFYGQPQDLEWAIGARGRLTVLQCRPLQPSESGPKGGDEPPAWSGPETVLVSGGVTASPGAASGPVFVVVKDMDALRFPDGGVLVAGQSQPRWAPLLSRATAVVTEHGSVAGHLANVAREFGVPALFGVAGATHTLPPGAMVTVDADGRRIFSGEVALPATAKPRNLMAGSPVLKTLEEVAALIVPLTLLDPDSPGFTPANCQTLHDITRFCHERSVREMFAQGKDTPVPEWASKQLHVGRPMQYWVIDLEDGFTEPVAGRYVRLPQIASAPMLALWRGMTAVPLTDPVALDTKGFLSVMVEATANPELEPAAMSTFAVRNYFMISREFVSLQSRFGFHFCTVEAHVGEVPEENYASFQFKGGAADMGRRIMRTRCLAAVLEDWGFRVESRLDAMFARIEGLPAKDMLDRLVILGHLIMHTRQLDMAMSGPAAMDFHRDKLAGQLKDILLGAGAAA